MKQSFVKVYIEEMSDANAFLRGSLSSSALVPHLTGNLATSISLLIACLYEVVWTFPCLACLRPTLQLPAFCGRVDSVSLASKFFVSYLCVPAWLNWLPFMACLSHLALIGYLTRLVSSASMPMLLSLAYLASNSDCLPLQCQNTWPQLPASLHLSVWFDL
jgi:hypothetical protein